MRIWFGLPARDWFLLPLLSATTLCLMMAVSELASRVIWPEHLQDACIVSDPQLGFSFRPSCRSIVKSTESGWIENAYNDCGYRTAESCKPRAPNSFRVAVIGSSIGSGYLIPYNETFAARATESLTRRCHIPVDFQNLAVPDARLSKASLYVEPALALKPDVLLMALTAHDLEVLGPDKDDAGTTTKAQADRFNHLLLEAAARLRASRAVAIAQHFLYENLDTYLPLYLKHRDEADYLRPPFSAAWQRRMELFEQKVKEIATQARAAGVPFIVMFIPQRPLAALLQWKHLPPGIDPTLLGKTLADIVQRNGAISIDLTETIPSKGSVKELYYAVDSHPNGTASAIIADAVVATLLAHHVPPAVCGQDRG